MELSESQRHQRSEANKGKKQSPETIAKRIAKIKGRPRSEETKRKIGDAHRGMKFSEEAKRHISESKKGKPSPSKGKRLSEEARKHMSEAKKGKPGRPHTEEEKRKISEANKGKQIGKRLSEETKRKISASQIGKVVSQEAREKIGRAHKGRVISEETRRKVSETKLKQARKDSEETRQKKREAGLRLASNPEYLAKVSAGVRKAFANPETQERWAQAMAEINRTKGRTSIELIVTQVLDALDIAYEPQKRIGRYIVDFFIPSKSLVIECDGDYWHSRPEVQERDMRKDTYLTQQGFDILRLSEQEIRKQAFNDLYTVLTE